MVSQEWHCIQLNGAVFCLVLFAKSRCPTLVRFSSVALLQSSHCLHIDFNFDCFCHLCRRLPILPNSICHFWLLRFQIIIVTYSHLCLCGKSFVDLLIPAIFPVFIWLVVWLPFFYFPIYWVANHPKWLSYFSEGWPNHQPVIHFVLHNSNRVFAVSKSSDNFIRQAQSSSAWCWANWVWRRWYGR